MALLSTLRLLRKLFRLSRSKLSKRWWTTECASRRLLDSLRRRYIVKLFLDEDAVILGIQDEKYWPLMPPLPSYGYRRERPGPRYRSLIHGQNLKNVVITGDDVFQLMKGITIRSMDKLQSGSLRPFPCRHVWDSMRAVRIKTAPGRGAYVRRITCRNLTLDRFRVGIVIRTDYHEDADEATTEKHFLCFKI